MNPSKAQTILEVKDTIHIQEFFPKLRAIHELLPDEVIGEAVVEAARTIATEANLIKRKFTIHPQAGVQAYPVTVCEEEIIRITTHPGCCPPCGAGQRSIEYTDIRNKLHFDPVSQQVTLTNCRVCESEICFGVITKPALCVCEIDSVFFRLYKELVVLLARYTLLNTDGSDVPWRDVPAAGVAYRQAMQQLRSLKTDVGFKHATGAIRIRNRRMV